MRRCVHDTHTRTTEVSLGRGATHVDVQSGGSGGWCLDIQRLRCEQLRLRVRLVAGLVVRPLRTRST